MEADAYGRARAQSSTTNVSIVQCRRSSRGTAGMGFHLQHPSALHRLGLTSRTLAISTWGTA
eukprot:scaffold7941_cov390-Prasinococcus_capsulatus_cf.AAC.5